MLHVLKHLHFEEKILPIEKVMMIHYLVYSLSLV